MGQKKEGGNKGKYCADAKFAICIFYVHISIIPETRRLGNVIFYQIIFYR